MGQAVHRRRGAAMRLAEGQVWPVLADRPDRAEGDASGQGHGPGGPRHAGPDDHGEDRHRPPATGAATIMRRHKMTSETSLATDRELVLTRLIDAPRAAVFQVWTDPDLLKQWFAPLPWTVSA